MNSPHCQTCLGIQIGPITVMPVMWDKKWGIWIEVRTATETLTVRSTPSGRLRVGKVEKVRR